MISPRSWSTNIATAITDLSADIAAMREFQRSAIPGSVAHQRAAEFCAERTEALETIAQALRSAGVIK